MFLWQFANESAKVPPTPPAAAAVPVEEPGDDNGNQEVTRILLMVLPWGVSLLLHAGVFMLVFFVGWAAIQKSVEDEVVIPSSGLTERNEFKLTTNLPTVTEEKVGRGVTADSGFQGVVKPPPAGEVNVGPGGGGVGESWGPGTGSGVGWGKGKGGGSGLIGIGGGSGGGGGSGKGTPYGLRQGGGKMGMFGLKKGSGVKRIIYVIDASGSLIDSMPFVLDELRRSINDLKDDQSFSVFFFQDEKVIEAPPPGWKKALEDVKRRTNEWCDPRAGNIAPQGVTSPRLAIKAALALNPEVVYVLSDNITGRGQFELSQRTVLEEIEKANKTAKAKINTIQFLYPDQLASYGMEPTLKLISQKTGGVYKYVDAGELGLR